ncbi:hypothetical protein JOD24_002643 [Kroppenstedtia sanguinis]
MGWEPLRHLPKISSRARSLTDRVAFALSMLTESLRSDRVREHKGIRLQFHVRGEEVVCREEIMTERAGI